MNKNILRKKMLDLRASLHLDKRNYLFAQITENITAHNTFKSANHIACYNDFNNEVSTQLLIEKIWAEKKICYLPILHPENSSKLTFIRYDKDDRLQKNKFGILEPRFSPDKIIPGEQLDLVFLPLVAFDRNGNRLGMGAGYYDKTFAFRQNPKSSKPLLIGLAFALQEHAEIPFDHWDILLDGVVTEKEWINISF
jgi:5-formyltetrahydrofolate cyclo-ligase